MLFLREFVELGSSTQERPNSWYGSLRDLLVPCPYLKYSQHKLETLKQILHAVIFKYVFSFLCILQISL